LEARILLAIHGWETPALDAVFLVANAMGTAYFLVPLILLASFWNARRGERAEALLWLGLGITTWLLLEGIKPLVARPRPALWPALVVSRGLSCPSGHALATATFFPLLARSYSRALGSPSVAAYAVAVFFVVFVSFGRLYLGVHWPTDVLAGWILGLAQSALALTLRDRLTRGVGRSNA
jgi:undecaprenyl-diphosphatase